ncbi:MAG: hypothetical protein ABSC37_03850 [Xanthobacteraceae bacterium]
MIPGIIEKYKSKGVLFDTNLLVLLVIGIYRRARIATFKRTRQYAPEDFALVLSLIEKFDRRITTPNILTEANNLVRQLPESEHPAVSRIMAHLIAEIFEQYRISAEAVRYLGFARLGLTDCITASIANEALVLTDDFRLSNTLFHLGRDVININHLRDFNT